MAISMVNFHFVVAAFVGAWSELVGGNFHFRGGVGWAEISAHSLTHTHVPGPTWKFPLQFATMSLTLQGDDIYLDLFLKALNRALSTVCSDNNCDIAVNWNPIFVFMFSSVYEEKF